MEFAKKGPGHVLYAVQFTPLSRHLFYKLFALFCFL